MLGARADSLRSLRERWTVGASHVAGPCGVVASIDMSTETRVLQLCPRAPCARTVQYAVERSEITEITENLASIIGILQGQ